MRAIDNRKLEREHVVAEIMETIKRRIGQERSTGPGFRALAMIAHGKLQKLGGFGIKLEFDSDDLVTFFEHEVMGRIRMFTEQIFEECYLLFRVSQNLNQLGFGDEITEHLRALDNGATLLHVTPRNFDA